MTNPYKNLGDNAFWKLAVADRNMFAISELWSPKFHLKQNHKVVTYGSCFAQHIGRALKERGFNWHRTEEPPVGLSSENCKIFNYDIFSSRTGNIYTTTLLKQWIKWCIDPTSISDETWVSGNRFIDPFRPRIEPDGFQSAHEARQSLLQTVNSFHQSIKDADVFVFTLGLTESWHNEETGVEYPMCPGTVAGDFDPEKHKFENLSFSRTYHALSDSINMMKEINPELRFILTVSPVPLTATYTGQHVVLATMAAKSTLRAVAHEFAVQNEYIDYFPSYEIINSPVFKGAFFEPNQRNVSSFGVNFVMNSFFECIQKRFGDVSFSSSPSSPPTSEEAEDAVCEEELLDAFKK
ncbi:GSCFA domain-containing protein [Alteromonas ponticola]|uniref:GSCFA domain-containing protein n=1 Tax=Alteromonas aquimaris TaxID=2998417 RepID=A0ABT3P5N4_9ALTE|nr:GSCFA domain-containing protein [Alteromonas aquimaris]MCW8108067.1 GSCFA domain-containing protein [Alteromonas aquimaris]